MEQILELFFGNPDLGLTYAPFPALAAVGISAGASLLGGIFGSKKAKRREKAARKEKLRLEGELRAAENNRQAIVNPYEGVKEIPVSMSNPFENIGVATNAATMQAEEADIALANTLDTIRSTGASAGGATALAQAALKSKKGIAASIEQQEAKNEQLKAEGEFKKEQFEQQAMLSEKQRVQQSEAAGKQFVFQQQENREVAKLNRLSAQITGQQQQEVAAQQAGASAISGAISGIGSAVSAGLTGKAFDVSDKRLKKNIKLIKYSPSGLKVYSFEYINKMFGDGVYQGVMSDEIPKDAVIKHFDGFDRVDYSKIDVEFKKI
jgi:hypothetical protein